MKILVINLDRSTDRLSAITEQLAKWELPFERIKAFEPNKETTLMHACMLSHRECLNNLDENGLAVVLEDDAILHESFYHHLKTALEEFPEDCAFGFLGYQLKENPSWNNLTDKWRSPQGDIEFNGCYAYIVNGKVKNLKEPTGEELMTLVDFPDMSYKKAINLGLVKGAFLKQPIVFHGSFPTTIEVNAKEPAGVKAAQTKAPAKKAAAPKKKAAAKPKPATKPEKKKVDQEQPKVTAPAADKKEAAKGKTGKKK